jgi:hypothetical protein
MATQSGFATDLEQGSLKSKGLLQSKEHVQAEQKESKDKIVTKKK